MNGLQLPPGVLVAMARQDAVERIRDEQERLDREAAAEDRLDAIRRAEAQFELWHGYTRAEMIRHYASQPESGRDPGAEYGSERRPEILIGGTPIPAREAAPRAQRATQMDELLNRARDIDADGSMARRVADYNRRRELQRQRETQAEIAYHQGEIARTTEAGFRIGY